MRFKLTIQNETPQLIPINYQYPLSAWIYKVFNRAEPEFARWLHEHGYAFNGNRKFKLFTFSNLQLNEMKFSHQPAPCLAVPPGAHHLQLSFCMEDAASHFIAGLFHKQELVIADRHMKAHFRVSSVEQMAQPCFGDTAHFRCLSPIVVSRPEMRNGKLFPRYISPEEPDYSNFLKENLLKRYVAAHQQVVVGMEARGATEEILTDLPFDTQIWDFSPISKPKSRLQAIKAGTPAETKVRGFVYEFKLKAAAELLEFAYEAGMGEKGSLGWGCFDVTFIK